MAITLTEQFLNITMNYGGLSGNKGYDVINGASHTIYIYSITDTRQIVTQGISSYSQTVAPMSLIRGRQPDILKIEGKLCHIDKVSTYLSPLGAYRNLNTIYNVFLPCSIVTGTSDGECPEIEGSWLVDTFKVKRSLEKRKLVLFELVLYKWYGSLPGST